ncbi:PREDICTED: protein THEM6 [Dinoponera quadriceps]|uniref:Protein THEM6 n=1 Tax=Dinoponera quadriceps TaxID=609295 RepID=A0A6P3XBQ5_DINQU|nr:PREDICTED: protein THEM6 [Dinoponera quadriceps]
MECFSCVAMIAIFYILFDVNYFLRVILTILWGRLFEKKKKLFETTTIYGICFTQDVDLILKHMNNARYLRELDFARFYFYDRTEIYGTIVKRGGSAVQGASSIRYRRAIPIFTLYKVTTKLIYWEDKHFYIEQQFITLTDNFIRAVVLSRQTTTGLKVPVQDIIAELEPEIRQPEPTKELQLWLDSMEESSQSLKKQK